MSPCSSRAGAAHAAQGHDVVVGLRRAWLVVAAQGIDHQTTVQRTLADRRQEVVHALLVEALEHALETLFAQGHPLALGGALQQFAPVRDVVVALPRAQEPPDARARLAGDHEAFPGGRRAGALAGDHLDLVAVVQPGAQRHQTAIHLGADAGVAHLRVDGIGEVDRRRALGQGDQVAARGEAEHLVLEHLELGVLEEFLGSGGLLEDLQEAAQPVVLPAVGRPSRLLVGPVRRDAELGHLVHLARADLHLDAPALGAENRGVQGTIAVRLGRADEVLEALRHHGVATVDHAERRVAVGYAVDGDAKRHDVRQLLEADVLALHLAPDGKRRLFAAVHLGLDAGVVQRLPQLADDALDQVAVVAAQLAQAVAHRLARIRPQRLVRLVLQFVLERLHADPLGERDVDLERLARDPLALVGARDEMQRAHVVLPVGELDQQHANVLGHGQQQLAEILGLLGARGLQLELVELGDAIDQAGHLGAEQPLDLGNGRSGVLDHVVQQAGGDRSAVELPARQDAGDFDGMRKIRIAGRPQLGAMGLHGIDVGPVEQLFVGARIVPLDALDQLVLPHQRPTGRRRCRSLARCRRLQLQGQVTSPAPPRGLGA